MCRWKKCKPAQRSFCWICEKRCEPGSNTCLPFGFCDAEAEDIFNVPACDTHNVGCALRAAEADVECLVDRLYGDACRRTQQRELTAITSELYEQRRLELESVHAKHIHRFQGPEDIAEVVERVSKPSRTLRIH